MTTRDKVEEFLRAKLTPEVLVVTDEGGSCSGAKLEVTVVTAAFEGLSRVERARLVQMDGVVKELFASHELHALSMKTLKTPEEYKKLSKAGAQ